MVQSFLAIASVSGLFSIPYEYAACGKAVQAKLPVSKKWSAHAISGTHVDAQAVHTWKMSLLDLPWEGQIRCTLLRSVAHSFRQLFIFF